MEAYAQHFNGELNTLLDHVYTLSMECEGAEAEVLTHLADPDGGREWNPQEQAVARRAAAGLIGGAAETAKACSGVCLAGWLAGCLVGWLVGSLVGWLGSGPIYRQILSLDVAS